MNRIKNTVKLQISHILRLLVQIYFVAIFKIFILSGYYQDLYSTSILHACNYIAKTRTLY